MQSKLAPSLTDPDPDPDPDPPIVTVNCSSGLNAAVTDSAPLIVTVHVVAVPEQPPPLHPANVDPAAGVSVNVTIEPVVKLSLHAVLPSPQSIVPGPPAVEVTTPEPDPAKLTDSTSVVGIVQLIVTDAAPPSISCVRPVTP
ncbi:MAG TPA: hypothetical protein VIJ51_09150 [Solirubrobacteraceae bacterium]